jgi:DNA-binding HxlR family transcriptional regulator
MNIKDIYGNDCPVLYAISIIHGKWRLPILWKLSEAKTLRFNELKREIPGITNIMLTQCLQAFEAENIVQRKVFPTNPPKVEYSLTDNGLELIEKLDGLMDWGKKSMSSTI